MALTDEQLERLLSSALSDEEKGVLFAKMGGCDNREQAFGLPDEVFTWAMRTHCRTLEQCRGNRTESRDREWVSSVCQPFSEAPGTRMQLEEALRSPLLEQIPVSHKRYHQLADQAQKFFAPPEVYLAEDISSWASMILDTSMVRWDGILYDLCFTELWKICLSSLSAVHVSTSTSDAALSGWRINFEKFRPELLLWARDRLVFKTEHNNAEDDSWTGLATAWASLDKSLITLDECFYGKEVEWIVGLATGGSYFRLGGFKRFSSEFLSPPLDSGHIEGRLELIKWSINLLRLALSWSQVLPDVHKLRPYDKMPKVRYGSRNRISRTMTLAGGRMKKSIWPWGYHEEDGFSTLEYVTQAYERVSSPHLVSGKVKLSRWDKYSVDMEVAGLHRYPTADAELGQVVRHVLLALRALHAAGLVHRDVTWKNVIYSESRGLWVLVDLETVWEQGQVPMCHLQDWEGATLVRGKFTPASDLHLLGVMLGKLGLPPRVREYADKLEAGIFISAEDALAALQSLEMSPSE